jgi:hypothetical protein
MLEIERGTLVRTLCRCSGGDYGPVIRQTVEEINETLNYVHAIWHPKPIHEVTVSQPPGRGPVPGPGINYTGPREVLLEVIIFVF